METKSATVVIIFLCATLSSSSSSEIPSLSDKPVYKCVLSGTTCTFSNVVLNSTHYEWQPTSDIPAGVFVVKFTASKIPVVTNDICKAFPNLVRLEMQSTGIEEIKEDAFHACAGLTILYLYENQIEKLHPNTFLYTVKLQELNFRTNRISKLDHYNLLTNLQDLQEFSCSQNNLTEFSPELIRNNKNLEILGLYSNDLSDIEAEQILDFLPNLVKFHIDDNELSCTRIVEVYKLLQLNGISTTVSDYKIRYYPQQKVFGTLKCNPDASWMASNYRKENSKNDQRFDAIDIKISDIREKMDQKFATMEEKFEKLFTLISQSKIFE